MKEINLARALGLMIADMRKGRKLQRSGRRFAEGTIRNYEVLLQLLVLFSEKHETPRIIPVRRLTSRELQRERNYWKRFERKFTDFLHRARGQNDNTVGQNMKLLKSFFNYLGRDKGIPVGDFHRNFRVVNEEIPIVVLQPEQLDRLIHDLDFEASLPNYLKRTKDFFVFGCTVALRVSDLLALNRSNLEQSSGRLYLSVRSKKTGERTRVALPDYAVQIVDRYKRVGKTLLPTLSIARLNENIKELAERAGWVHEVAQVRMLRGKPVARVRKDGKSFRFCDLVSTHTMRRTAITTMLRFGMPELLVRRISGHRDGSREFYKYVRFAQSYQDQETDKVFSKFQRPLPAVSSP